jgi:hypothetical protein
MLFTCTDHDGHYPVGVASIVVAESEAEARQLLGSKLLLEGLKPDAYTLSPVDESRPQAIILANGNY